MAKRPKIKSKLKVTLPAKNFITVFKKEVKIRASKMTREIAEEVVAEAKDVIESQKYKWKPLNEKYKAWKEKNALDNRMMVATRDYLDNGIGVQEVGAFIFAGPLPGKHKPSGLTYAHLARIHEFGTDRIPARPMWRTILAQVMAKRTKFAKKYREESSKALKRSLKTKTKIKRT